MADGTYTGGPDNRFTTTVWTEILAAQKTDEARHRAFLAEFAGRYWKPVYWHLRQRGFDNERAKDVAQGFFCDVVLARKLLQKADRARGRFRTFLLTALDNYATSTIRKERAGIRRPSGDIVPLDVVASEGDFLVGMEVRPDEAFAYAWASALVDEVVKTVAGSCASAGLDRHWQAFRRSILDPTLSGAPRPSPAQLCRELEVKDKKALSNMITTVKRRFKVALRKHIRSLVASDDEVDGEICTLMEILSSGSFSPGPGRD